MCGPSWMRRSARLCISCCASVLATTNSTPCRFARDHVVDRVGAAAADTDHGDARAEVGVRSLRDGQVQGHCDFSPSRADSLTPDLAIRAAPEARANENSGIRRAPSKN